MINTIKNIIIISLMAFCIYLMYRMATDRNSNVKRVDDVTEEALVKAEVKIVKREVDEKGIERVIIDDYKQVFYKTEQLDIESLAKIDSLKGMLKIKDRQIISLTEIKTKLEADNLKATNVGDTSYYYEDKFARISFNKPKQEFSLRYDASVNTYEYWRKRNLFASKKRYIDIWVDDPRVTIQGVKRLRYEPKREPNKLKIKAVANYNGLNRDIYTGGGVEYNTRRLDYQGNYLYDTKSKTWFPSVGIEFKILEF